MFSSNFLIVNVEYQFQNRIAIILYTYIYMLSIDMRNNKTKKRAL
nr:MAG TPA: hypothetical protein [Caudoviricetes sp.]